tara:strand:+ start:800 stop:1045 length:246 start_codon:yes stop_codon:yes gene_type:complete
MIIAMPRRLVVKGSCETGLNAWVADKPRGSEHDEVPAADEVGLLLPEVVRVTDDDESKAQAAVGRMATPRAESCTQSLVKP